MDYAGEPLLWDSGLRQQLLGELAQLGSGVEAAFGGVPQVGGVISFLLLGEWCQGGNEGLWWCAAGGPNMRLCAAHAAEGQAAGWLAGWLTLTLRVAPVITHRRTLRACAPPTAAGLWCSRAPR